MKDTARKASMNCAKWKRNHDDSLIIQKLEEDIKILENATDRDSELVKERVGNV